MNYVGIWLDRHRVYVEQRPMLCVMRGDDVVVFGRLVQVVGLARRHNRRESSGRSNRKPVEVVLIFDDFKSHNERCNNCGFVLLSALNLRPTAVRLQDGDNVQLLHVNPLMRCKQRTFELRNARRLTHWNDAVEPVSANYVSPALNDLI